MHISSLLQLVLSHLRCHTAGLLLWRGQLQAAAPGMSLNPVNDGRPSATIEKVFLSNQYCSDCVEAVSVVYI
jgi:hypothetical protein